MWTAHVERYGFTPYDLAILSGGHSFGISVSTNPQVCAMPPMSRQDSQLQASMH